MIKSNNIKWYKLKFTYNYFFLLKSLDFLKILFFPLFIILFKKINVVHCRGHLPAIPGLISKILFKKKFIFDCRGLWADERIDNHSWNNKNIFHNKIYIFFKKLEYLYFNKADHIIVLTQKIKNILLQSLILESKNLSVIPCCADFNFFRIFPKVDIIKRKTVLNLIKNDLVIGYFGSISNIYLPNEMINFFLYCKKIYKNPILIFFSDNFTYLINQTKNFKKLKVHDYKLISLSPNNLPINYNICDLTLCFVKNSKARDASSPTKIAESLACGVPVLCNSGVGDIDNHLTFYDHSVFDVRNNSNLEKISKLIYKFKKINKKVIRSKSRKYYDKNIAHEEYNNIYKKILDINSN